jgi:transcriptional regulator with XRE-family HTH domain
MIAFETLLTNQFKNDEFRAEWERLAPARAVAIRLVRYRAEHDLTQTGLAHLIGISQPAVARLEIGEHMPTLAMLIRLSDALDLEFLIDVRPKARQSDWVSPEVGAASVIERVDSAGGSQLLFAVS